MCRVCAFYCDEYPILRFYLFILKFKITKILTFTSKLWLSFTQNTLSHFFSFIRYTVYLFFSKDAGKVSVSHFGCDK